MKWKALLKDVKGDHFVSRNANFAFIQNVVCKKWFLCKMCIYIYIYIYIYLHIYIYTYFTYIYIYTYLHRFTYIYIFLHILTYIFTYIYIYLHIYIHMFTYIYIQNSFIYLHIYTYIYIYIHIFTSIYIHNILYIYTYVCVRIGGRPFLHITHHGSRWYCRSWGRAQQELELLPEDGDYPPPDLSSLDGRASHRSFGNGCSPTCICILVYKIYKLHIGKYLNDM